MPLLALRGAITIETDTPKQIAAATSRMLTELFDRNSLVAEDVISIVFSATADIRSAYPAAAARSLGLVDVPLLCTQEMLVEGSLALCIRLMMHVDTDKQRSQIQHVFLAGATVLRPELARPGDEALGTQI